MPTSRTTEPTEPDETEPTETKLDETVLDEQVRRLLHRHPAVGLALGVVRDGRLGYFHGHGVADIATGRPVTESTVFRVASISKTVTAVAVMQLWEQGLVDLDAPATDQLHSYRLVPARPGHRPATVRDLLTHTAGLPEVVHPARVLGPDFGESVRQGRRLATLAEYYRGELRLAAEPGTRFVYGNHSFATLGQLIEDVSGAPLARYLREHVFDPLGMTQSDLTRSGRVEPELARGYRLGAGGARRVVERDMVTAGAASVYASTRDMARYVAALLGGGSNEHGSVLRPETVATMFRPHYRPDPRIPGIGLGFFRTDLGGRPGVEHQGIHPGFNSQLLLAPEDGLGVVAFTNGARQAELWLLDETEQLLRRLLNLPEEAIRSDLPQRPHLWRELCGWYQLPARLSDIRLRAMVGAGAEVVVRRGRLWLRGLSPLPPVYRGFPLLADDERDPYAFRVDLAELGFGSFRVVFSPASAVQPTTLHLDLMPLSLYQRSARTNPRRWTVGTLGALGALGGLAAATTLRKHQATD